MREEVAWPQKAPDSVNDRGSCELPVSVVQPPDRTLESLLDGHFDGRPGLTRELPLLVGGDPRSRCLVMRQDDACVAHAAWRRLDLIVHDETVTAAGIGLVTTHTAMRGRGLATRLVEACVEEARRAGAVVALLFGAERRLYTRLGFVPAGRERVTLLRAVPNALDRSSQLRAGGVGDARVLLACLHRQPLRVERSLAEMEVLLRIPDMRVHVLEVHGQARAYCIEGKGRDLGGVVHEWAGEPELVSQMLGAVAATETTPLYALSPDALPPPAPGEHQLGHLALMRVLDPDAVGSPDATRVFGSPSHPAERPVYVWGLDSV